MSLNQYMQPRQRLQFQAVGEFLYIDACPDMVSVTTERGGYQLKQGAQIIDPKLTGMVTVENMGEAGTVTIICGFGRYIPPTDGQKVEVTTLPSVTLSPEQEVNIGTIPSVKIAPYQSVEVSELPAVRIAQYQRIAVSSLPAVSLKENQQVAVTGLPDVKLATGQEIAVKSLPKVQLETGQAVKVYATNPLLTKPVIAGQASGSALAVTAGKIDIAENTSRCHILLKAGPANTAAIVLGTGWELAAGEQLKLETSAALSFTGTDGDTLQMIEVTR
ncbi:hypothetical protein [Photobacterium sp. TY1-4]|uniref:hypothetical protein n=1 Tax=Photobacterium sp. TY1-4 TaxID=2899122 RepID=UPI0021BE4B61|nr:hypothetical protein [Photobacterium sp. TY1-4]UXI02747.1 hypothetical protein NH461_08305 [Photobacterium sp. TY1-4]